MIPRPSRPAANLVTLALVGLVTLAANPSAAGEVNDPPVFHGTIRQYTLLQPAEPAPLTPILDYTGAVHDLSRYRGQVVLLNLWASWCVPCLWELPSLDRLQAALGGERFTVLALSIDEEGFAAARPYFENLGLRHLGLLRDLGGAEQALAPTGLPATYVIDHRGRLMGYLMGPAVWDSPSAMTLVGYYIARIGE